MRVNGLTGWPKQHSQYTDMVTMRKSRDGTHFALETSFIGDYPKFRILAAGKDLNAVKAKVDKFYSARLGEVLSELKHINQELIQTPEGPIENRTVNYIEDMRDERGDAYAYSVANNILETQQELAHMCGDVTANEMLNEAFADAEDHLRNNLPEDNG